MQSDFIFILNFSHSFFFIYLQFLNVLALGFLAVIVRNPSMISELQNNYDDPFEAIEPPLPTPLSVDRQQYAFRDHSLNNRKLSYLD